MTNRTFAGQNIMQILSNEMPGVTFTEIKPLPAEYTEIICERNVLKEMHDNGGYPGISLCLMTLILHNTDSCRIIHLHIWALFMQLNIHWKHTIFLLRLTAEKVCLHYSNDVSAEYSGAVDTRILNIERDGSILFCWKVSPRWQHCIPSVCYAECTHEVSVIILILLNSALLPV